MMGHDGIGHHVVIVETIGDSITYAHSGGTHGRENYHGGVEYGSIKLTDINQPIEKQEWGSAGDIILKEHYDFKTRRLKVLADSADA